jgi:hypothetical protein
VIGIDLVHMPRHVVPILLLIACSSGTEDNFELPVSCTAVAKRESEACGTPEDLRIYECDYARRTYEPIGCGAQAALYIACHSSEPVDCEYSSNRCPEPEIYGRCESQFVRLTGCVRLEGQDDQCSAGMFAFNCVSDLPSGCIEAGPSTLGKSACCPSFARGSNSFVD